MINTVTGLIKKEDLGPTLSHEHLAWDYNNSWNLYFYKIYDEKTIDELFSKLLPIFNDLYRLGVRSIAEASPPRGGQNLKLMQKLSLASNIQIIPNTGLPFGSYFYDVHKNFDINELANRWIKDYNDGLDTLNDIVIRPAQIKLLLGDENIGKLTKIDEKILKAALIASENTGMPIHCHLLYADTASSVIDLLEHEKFDFNKFLWAHAGNEGNLEVIEKAFNKGMWLGIDEIRPENYSKSCTLIKESIKRGFENKILLSQDYDFYEEINKSQESNCTSFMADFMDYCSNHGIKKEIIMDFITINPANYFNID